MTRAVMQQALEALENAQGNYGDYWMDTIAALRNALAKQEAESHLQAVADFGQLQEREPVAWQWLDTATFRKKIPPTGESECWNPLYASPPKRQPEQEPVGFVVMERQPLTHEQRLDLLTAFAPSRSSWNAESILIDMVEAAHDIGEKT